MPESVTSYVSYRQPGIKRNCFNTQWPGKMAAILQMIFFIKIYFYIKGPIWYRGKKMIEPIKENYNIKPKWCIYIYIYIHRWTMKTLVQIMACCLNGTKPSSKPMLTYHELDPWEQTPIKFYSKYISLILKEMYMKMSSMKCWPSCLSGQWAKLSGTSNTLRPRQKGRNFHMTFSKAFSWMKMYELRFHWSLLLGVELTISQHWFR